MVNCRQAYNWSFVFMTFFIGQNAPFFSSCKATLLITLAVRPLVYNPMEGSVIFSAAIQDTKQIFKIEAFL